MAVGNAVGDVTVAGGGAVNFLGEVLLDTAWAQRVGLHVLHLVFESHVVDGRQTEAGSANSIETWASM